ncbi:SRPBCC family protein [Sphingomonas sp.]|jgi:uncharacterized membrane protein|uniref:SRPBCC family protein n=1 Tax=Sphingomonas sp. TaxID=28214 RepID=UPI002E349271|nr:SRPBCC family protein [Sphingomonas sp.]HEX4693444.1 SRPBCC family protein [Sphingomonas sp.]
MPPNDVNTADAPPEVEPRDTRDDAPPTTAKDLDADRELVGRSVTINRPVVELYAYFRDFSNVPSFMENIVRIDVRDATHSHWVVKAPGGKTVEWDATVTREVENEEISWRSDEGADVPNSGKIEFRDAGARGTIVTATIAYEPPAGTIGKLIAKLFQREPAIQARRDLRRFKQLMETGEIATPAMNRKQFEEMGL